MLKQSFNRMKKGLAILLVVLFVVSVTAVAASADRGDQGGHGDHGNRGDHGAGHNGYHDGGNRHWRHHYNNGRYYANCDWVWDPHTSQYIWTC
jgi:hypothetical protein